MPKQLKAIGKGNKPNGADVLSDNCPFYLAINTEVPKAGKNWFKAFPLGVNSLRSMVASQVQSNKKLVNRSTRKHLVQKLVDSNIPPNEIVQITRHKNINSLNNYSAISDKRVSSKSRQFYPEESNPLHVLRR